MRTPTGPQATRADRKGWMPRWRALRGIQSGEADVNEREISALIHIEWGKRWLRTGGVRAMSASGYTQQFCHTRTMTKR